MLQMAPPYEDELISSAVIRGCRHFGLTFATLAQVAFKRSSMNRSFLTVAPLRCYEELFAVPAQRLLEQHTIVPYAVAFSTKDVRQRALEAALGDDQARYGLPAVILRFSRAGPGAGQYLRYCESCMARDEQVLGETYWRRSHQLPGCYLCWEHNELLFTTERRLLGKVGGYHLPCDVRGRPCLSVEPSSNWLDVARVSARLIGQGMLLLDERPADFYRQTALERGWLDAENRGDSSHIVGALIDHFGESMLLDAGLIGDKRARPWWSVMLQSSPGMSFSTLRHVVMERLLRETPSVNHRPRLMAARIKHELDERLAPEVERIIGQYKLLGRRCLTRSILEEAGCWQAYRRSGAKALMPRIHSLISELRRSNLGCRPLSSELFQVPGQERLSHRFDLIKGGYLLGAREAGALLGKTSAQLRELNRSGRILALPYNLRQWYPAFWCSKAVNPVLLEKLHLRMRHIPLRQRWRMFSTCFKMEEEDRSEPALRRRSTRRLIAVVNTWLRHSYKPASGTGERAG